MVSIRDRGFLYGDGLFETMRVYAGRPFRWEQHLERLNRGADFLRIRVPFGVSEQRQFAGELFERNRLPDCVLRITLSRGLGQRGYSSRDANAPTFAMTLSPAPPSDPGMPSRQRLVRSSVCLPAENPLSAFKTTNKLPQIVARAEADAAGADEALLLNHRGEIVEGTASNLFWVEDDSVFTPGLASGALPGITRGVVFELCSRLNIPVHQTLARPDQVRGAEGIFLTNSVMGVVEVGEFDGVPLGCSPLVEKLRSLYAELVQSETAHAPTGC